MRKKSRKKFPDALNNKVSSLLVPLKEKKDGGRSNTRVFTIPKKTVQKLQIPQLHIDKNPIFCNAALKEASFDLKIEIGNIHYKNIFIWEFSFFTIF